jgi:hypothetical protein
MRKSRRQYWLKYYKKHKAWILARNKSWYESHPKAQARHLFTKRKWQKTLRGKYSNLLSQAGRRHLKVKITFDDFKNMVLGKRCFYCNGNLPKTGGSLDRVKPSLGYIKNNVRPCCTDCNISKLNKTEKQFKSWVLQVARHWASK